MSNAKEILTNLEFEVQLGLMLKINFATITDISSQSEFDIRADGGNNDRMFFSPKPRRMPDRIVFNKGVSTGMDARVMSWLTPGLVIEGVMINVKQDGIMQKVLYIDEGIVSRISFSNLDALRGEAMIKSMELQHTGIMEYDSLS